MSKLKKFKDVLKKIYSKPNCSLSLIGLLMFYIIPFFVMFGYSFMNNPISKSFVGFDNYISVICSNAFRLAFKNTLLFTLFAVPLSLILSVLLALFVERVAGKGGFLYSVILSPLVIPVTSVSLIYLALFDSKGFINGIIVSLGHGEVDWLDSMWAPFVVMILFLWKNLGYNMVMFMAALAGIPKEYLEVAYLDTSSKWLVFKKIKLRYLLPNGVFVTVMTIINSFKVFREVYALTGKYPSDEIYLFQHYINNLILDKLDYSKVSAATILLFIVLLIVIILLVISYISRFFDFYKKYVRIIV